MGVSSSKHERLVLEHETELREARERAERAKADLEAHKTASQEEHEALTAELARLEEQKAKLVGQQKTLQADYSEMESIRQEREAQVVQRCILRIFQRCVGVCFKEWKDVVTEIVRERDREQFAAKVEELAVRNKQLKAEVDAKKKEVEAVEEDTQQNKVKQLLMRLKYKEVAICYNQWKGYVRANVEERHQRNIEALQLKLGEMVAERDRLRTRLTDVEREGLKLALTKFELEEKDLRKEGHIAELAGALTEARDTIQRQVEQWPSSTKAMQRELKALDSAYAAVTAGPPVVLEGGVSGEEAETSPPPPDEQAVEAGDG